MKKCKILLLVAFIGVFALSSGFAQNVKDSNEYKRALTVYLNAVKYNDIAVAKTALYDLIAIDPADISLKDSLSFYYFDYQQYPSAILVAKDILKKKPDHLAAVEICALSFENLGLLDKAVEYYETLYLKTNDIYNLYKVAYMQYNLKRYKECDTSIDILLSNKQAEEVKMIFTTSENKQQEVSMKAAVLNIKGLISKDLGDKVAAKKHFEDALKLAPEFALAKENLKEL